MLRPTLPHLLLWRLLRVALFVVASVGMTLWAPAIAVAEEGPSPAQSKAQSEAQSIRASYRYVHLTAAEAYAELDRRSVPYVKVERRVGGVLAPIRLTGPLHGVHIHSSLPEDKRATSAFEILDARLALSLNDFAAVLARHDIVELVHFTMYRPNGLKPGTEHQHAKTDKTKKRAATAKKRSKRSKKQSTSKKRKSSGKKTTTKSSKNDKAAKKKRSPKKAAKKKSSRKSTKLGKGAKRGKRQSAKRKGAKHARKQKTLPKKKKPKKKRAKGTKKRASKKSAAKKRSSKKSSAKKRTAKKPRKGSKGSARRASTKKRSAKKRSAKKRSAKKRSGKKRSNKKSAPPAPKPVAYSPPGTRHPAGLAIDVGGFRKRDGRWLGIAQHFKGKIGRTTCGRGASPANTPESRELWSIACESVELGIFTYVLTPNYDQAHFDHFHMEIRPEVTWHWVK